MAQHEVFVRHGAIGFSWADATCSLPELIFATVREALDRSELPIEAVDSVVLSAHDLVDGRSLTSMTTAPAAGCYLREEIRLGDDGALALTVAEAQILAGQASECIVAAWGRASEGDPDAISRALFDPFYAAPFGLRELDISAMRAAAALGQWPDYALTREAAAARLSGLVEGHGHTTGPRPAVPGPLRFDEVAPTVDVVAAIVVCSTPTDVALTGTGVSADPYWPGDRMLLRLTALRDAAGLALERAGRRVADVGCFELDGPTLFDEALALEAVGAARPGCGMRALAEDPRVQRSGGSALGACAPAMGLVRAVSAERIVRAGEADLALASGGSTVAGQSQAAIVLERC
ncbi:MAG: hypothetical protein ACYDHH_21505 [Solirubrobacteraceae bacterium]